MNENRVIYFDFLRVFATIFVIMLHVSASYFPAVNVHSLEWKMFNFYDSISRWAVPLFVMISGSLFLRKSPDVHVMYRKYILRIAAAFFIWSALYIIHYTNLYGVAHPLSQKEVLMRFIKGHYHMWFLAMLFGVYAMVPLLKPIVESKTRMNYFLLLSFVLSILFPTLISVLKDGNLEIANVFYYQKGRFDMSFGYLFYFVLGYWMDRNDTRKIRGLIYVLGIVGFVFTVIATDILSVKIGTIDDTFYNELTLNVLFETVAVFQLFKDVFPKISIGEQVEKWTLKLSNYCFGIYLVHPMIIEVLDHYGFNSLSFTSVLSVPVITLIVWLISLIISAVLNRIPIINKYIV